MATPPSFVADAIMDMKRKALAAKQGGDISTAKAFLQQARELEQPTTSQTYQRLAMIYKQNGDIEGAKDALRKSKQLKMEEEAVPEPLEDEVSAPPVSSVAVEATCDTTTSKQVEAPKYSDPVNQAIDEANLEELTGGGGGVSYTIEEMLDVDTMADMQASGMPIPSADEYQQQAAACKRKALAAKQSNDMAGAKQHLITAKQLLAASERLFSNNTTGSMDDGEDGEDYSLLDELMNEGPEGEVDEDGFIQVLFGAGATSIELDDLDDMDADMLKDMIEAGMEVPDVNDILQQSKEKKAMALAFKNEGNMVAAKGALEESKHLERKAKQLSDLLRSVEKGNEHENLDPDAMFEAMMRATDQADKQRTAPSGNAQQTKPEPEVPAVLKASHEYKAEAVKLKQENRMDEALAALRLYKKALETETLAAESAKRADCQKLLEQEIDLVCGQIRCFRFYKRFVDQDFGGEQAEAWTSYHKRCKSILADVVKGGALPDMSVRTPTPTVKRIVGAEDLGFVGGASTDPRIEVCVMEVFDIQGNKHFRKYLEGLENKDEFRLTSESIQVQGVIQLPPSADLPEDNVEFSINANTYEDGTFHFAHSSFVDVERGMSRFAKLLRRRLARRRLTVDVLLVPIKKKSFWSSKGKSEPLLLGTAVVDLKYMLEKRSIAGDFPLLDITRRHELGGKVRIGVCTTVPFGENAESDTASTGVSSPSVELQPYSFFSLGIDNS